MAESQPVTYPLGARWPDNMDVADPYTPSRFDVIGEIGHVPAGNTILRIGRTWPMPQQGWMQELHLVLTPAERDQLIADLAAHEPAPAVDVVAEQPENTDLAWAWDGGIARGTVDALADFLCGAQLAGHDHPKVVYAATADGHLTPVPFSVKASPYDSSDYATATVSVTLADGIAVTGTWTVDGRS